MEKTAHTEVELAVAAIPGPTMTRISILHTVKEYARLVAREDFHNGLSEPSSQAKVRSKQFLTLALEVLKPQWVDIAFRAGYGREYAKLSVRPD